MTETRTYRGATLEEVLPRIREELGPDAVITRQREGVVGGIGGFFGKKCIEVEAQAPEEAGEDDGFEPLEPSDPVAEIVAPAPVRRARREESAMRGRLIELGLP